MCNIYIYIYIYLYLFKSCPLLAIWKNMAPPDMSIHDNTPLTKKEAIFLSDSYGKTEHRHTLMIFNT
jgi:hypothetical protein